MSHKEHHSSQANEQWRSPAEVLEVALTLIEPDGSVYWHTFDDDNRPLRVTFPPHEAQDTRSLQPDVYARQLLFLARELHNHTGRRSVRMEHDVGFERRLWSLAHYLTAFHHDRAFLDEALSLITPDTTGRWTIPPRLPEQYVFGLVQRRHLQEV
jgi:hypothetical protein